MPGIPSFPHAHADTKSPLNNSKLGSRNVQRINVSRQPRKSLLRAVWSDEGVDLDGGHVVLLLQRRGDLALVGFDVDDEDERVVLLDLLHGRLGVERVDEDLAGIEARLVRNRLAGVLGGAATMLSVSLLTSRSSQRQPMEGWIEQKIQTYESSRVFGRWKLVLLRTFLTLCELTFTLVNIAALSTRSKSRQRCGSGTPCRSWG